MPSKALKRNKSPFMPLITKKSEEIMKQKFRDMKTTLNYGEYLISQGAVSKHKI